DAARSVPRHDPLGCGPAVRYDRVHQPALSPAASTSINCLLLSLLDNMLVGAITLRTVGRQSRMLGDRGRRTSGRSKSRQLAGAGDISGHTPRCGQVIPHESFQPLDRSESDSLAGTQATHELFVSHGDPTKALGAHAGGGQVLLYPSED